MDPVVFRADMSREELMSAVRKLSVARTRESLKQIRAYTPHLCNACHNTDEESGNENNECEACSWKNTKMTVTKGLTHLLNVVCKGQLNYRLEGTYSLLAILEDLPAARLEDFTMSLVDADNGFYYQVMISPFRRRLQIIDALVRQDQLHQDDLEVILRLCGQKNGLLEWLDTLNLPHGVDSVAAYEGALKLALLDNGVESLQNKLMKACGCQGINDEDMDVFAEKLAEAVSMQIWNNGHSCWILAVESVGIEVISLHLSGPPTPAPSSTSTLPTTGLSSAQMQCRFISKRIDVQPDVWLLDVSTLKYCLFVFEIAIRRLLELQGLFSANRTYCWSRVCQELIDTQKRENFMHGLMQLPYLREMYIARDDYQQLSEVQQLSNILMLMTHENLIYCEHRHSLFHELGCSFKRVLLRYLGERAVDFPSDLEAGKLADSPAEVAAYITPRLLYFVGHGGKHSNKVFKALMVQVILAEDW